MAFNFKTFWAGIKIKPKTTSTANSKGDLEVIDSTGKLGFHNGSTVSPVVTESHAASLTNKTIDVSANTVITAASGSLVATELNAALAELDSDITAVSGAKVSGPASAIDNAIVRFDGTTGKLIQNSSVTIDDTGVIARAAGLVLNSTAGNIIFTPVATGESQFNYSVKHNNSVFRTPQIDATAGANLSLTVGDKSTIVLTGATSVNTLIPYSAFDGQLVTLINGTASDITINNETGAAVGGRIITGTGAAVTVVSGSSVSLIYSTATSRWSIPNNTTALNNHLVNAVDAHDASAISNIPSGNLAATEVQAALNELQTDIDTRATSTALTTHINNITGAHAASAISNTPSGNLAATQVQAALNELQSDIDTRLLATGGTFTSGSIVTPVRSDVKQDTLANLITYALTAANGQIVYATDEKSMYQVVDTELVGIGGAGIVKLTAGENISALDLVYISTGTGNDSGRTAGRLYKVDASNDDRNEVLGFATKTVTSGNTGEAQVSGNLKGFTGLTPGKIYYASASVPGAITLTPPSTNGQWVVAVCLASKATEIVINPVSSASAIYVVDGDTSFTIANNQSSAANVTGLLFDGVSTRSFIIDYSVYRQTDTALSALAQSGQLRGVYNTQSSTWFMSDDFSGQNSGATFTILSSGQLQYTSTNIAGANYVGSLKYAIRKTFGV